MSEFDYSGTVLNPPASRALDHYKVTLDDVPPVDGDDLWDPGYRADPKRYSRSALIGVIAAREAWSDAGLRVGEPEAGVIVGRDLARALAERHRN